MTITAIEPQQKDKDRVSLMVDHVFVIGLYIDIVWEFRLKIGQTIDHDKLNQLRQADNQQRAYVRALAYLARRPRSAYEMEQYLRQKLIYKHPEWASLDPAHKDTFINNQQMSINTILDKLSCDGYLDDAKFASWWIENRQAFKPRGPKLLRQELQAKGLSVTHIDHALQQYLHTTDSSQQQQQMVEVARKYIRKQVDRDPNKLKPRLFRHLASKGYDWDAIVRVWDDL